MLHADVHKTYRPKAPDPRETLAYISAMLRKNAALWTVLRSSFQYEPHVLVLREKFADQNLERGHTAAPIRDLGLLNLFERVWQHRPTLFNPG